MKVARPTGRGIISDAVAMGATLLDVARTMTRRWQERRRGVTSSDVVAMGATILEVERETSGHGNSDKKRVKDVAIAMVV
jgi:hypothetical protein